MPMGEGDPKVWYTVLITALAHKKKIYIAFKSPNSYKL
jgi:hypothetical protein